MMIDAFLPSNLATITLSVAAAVQHAALPVGTISPINNWRVGGEYLEVQNTGGVNVFMETGPGGEVGGVQTCNVVATVAASYPVLPGQCKVIRRAPGDTHMSIIGAAAGPTVVFVTAGNGV